LVVGRTLLRPVRPELASIMGMALAGDLADTDVDDGGFRSVGIEPRAASEFIAAAASRPA
jgi:hypothetical protein